MIPVTMMDELSYLQMVITFKDGFILKKNEFSPTVFLQSSPLLLDRIKNGQINMIELSGILSGWDSLDLLLDFMYSKQRVEDIKSIDWVLTVYKDSQSIYSLLDIIKNEEVYEVLNDILDDDNNYRIENLRKILLVDFLGDLFRKEISHGLNLEPYILRALNSGIPEDLVPSEYSIAYEYHLNIQKNDEDFKIHFIDDESLDLEDETVEFININHPILDVEAFEEDVFKDDVFKDDVFEKNPFEDLVLFL